MTKYRKKPIVIEAFQYGIDSKPDWFMDKVLSNDIILRNEKARTIHSWPKLTYCEIKTLEGIMRGNYKDYIIKGIRGEIYPCKADIFEATYEKV